MGAGTLGKQQQRTYVLNKVHRGSDSIWFGR